MKYFDCVSGDLIKNSEVLSDDDCPNIREICFLTDLRE